MKMRAVVMVIVAGIAGLAFQASAAPPTSSVTSVTNSPPTANSQLQQQVAIQNTPSASTIAPKRKIYWFTPAPSKAPSDTRWYGQDSSRSWTEVCGWRPGQTQFPSAETAEPQLVLLQVEWGR